MKHWQATGFSLTYQTDEQFIIVASQDPKEILREELERLRLDIITQQSTLGIKDSGRSADSIKIVQARGLSAELTAVGYLATNFDKVGRRPGRQPPVDDILLWGKLQPEGNETRLQAAFKVARAIGEMGTLIFRGAQGIDITELTKQSATRVSKALAENSVLQFSEATKRAIESNISSGKIQFK